MTSIPKEISSNTLDIDFDTITDEIASLYEHRKNFFLYIKDNMKSKSKSKSKKAIQFSLSIPDSLSSESNTQITGYKIKIDHINNDQSESLILLAYDKESIIYSKELIIPKTVNIEEIIKNFNKIIFKENIITNLKLLIDKINDTSKEKIQNNLNTEEINELLENIKLFKVYHEKQH